MITALLLPPSTAPAPLVYPAPVAFCLGGPARIGYNDGFSDEAPAHLVDVPSFSIGIDPITNRDYATFLADSGTPPPRYWHDTRLNQPAQPVVGVTWHNAATYCLWLTVRLRSVGVLPLDQIVRLPTEVEWEKAASWNPAQQQQRRYPWGNTWNPAYAVTAASSSAFPLPIGGRPQGASAYGVQDMLGNVWEWTESVYTSYAGAAAPFAEADQYVIRGGSCALRPRHMRCSYRCRLPPDAWQYHLGFRVVIAAPLP